MVLVPSIRGLFLEGRLVSNKVSFCLFRKDPFSSARTKNNKETKSFLFWIFDQNHNYSVEKFTSERFGCR